MIGIPALVLMAAITISAEAPPATGNSADIRVVVTNTAVAERISISAQVTYTLGDWPPPFTTTSAPVGLEITHPANISSIDLNLPAPWLQLAWPAPFTLLDGQAASMMIPIGKVEIKL
jgi:hypothetical protein